MGLIATILAAIATIATVFWKWRQSRDPKELHRQIDALLAEKGQLAADMDRWIHHHGGPGEYDRLHRRYTDVCREIGRLRGRLGKDDPYRSE